MEKFRWAFIGMGTLGRRVAGEITASGRHEVAAIYTRNAQNRAKFASELGALAAESAEEAMRDVDGVYIVTPHTSHYEYAKAALTLGKPVLCEKPLTTDAKKAAELIALSEERGVYLAEAMWTWFSPVANKVKAWLDAGEYGEIKSVAARYHLRSIDYAPRVSDPMLAGGALLDVGIYPITYIYRLFGMPDKVVCRGRLGGGIDLGEEIEMVYGEKIFTVSASITDMKGLERIRIRGTKAKTDLWFYHGAKSVTLRRSLFDRERFDGDGSMLNEFDIAASEIREGLTESRLVPHRATLDVMRIMDDCRAQMGLIYPFEK